MNKVLLLTNTIAPYRIPVLNKLQRDDNTSLTVWYLEEKEQNRKWDIDYGEIEYAYKCLPGVHAFIQKWDMGIHLNPGIFMRLMKHNPDVVITSGYDSLGYWSALLYSKLFRKKFIIWWGSTLESSRVQNKLVNTVRRVFFKLTDSFITYGTQSAECLEHYGVSKDKIVIGYNTVDIRFFHKKYKEHKRSKLRSDEGPIKLLFIGQLIERKGLAQIIDAIQQTHSDAAWQLTIVGSGPDEQRLKARVEQYGLTEQISFEGYKQKDELIDYLVEADCLIFPSLIEVWGLVVNEALSTNTFVVASKYAGATKDIIVDKQNGLIIDPLDPHNLKEAMDWVFANKRYIQSSWQLKFGLWRKMHPNYYARAVSSAVNRALSTEG
ncbi:glycosyltransferase family 4 protein [Paenibacillus sp. KS-LC4]|uniref:glycosyltransferase family 4 protein n=1 Tax=Paenibacillus sp. KS-LC4 TaxID=2979727 RepID=UPI0030D2295C